MKKRCLDKERDGISKDVKLNQEAGNGCEIVESVWCYRSKSRL